MMEAAPAAGAEAQPRVRATANRAVDKAPSVKSVNDKVEKSTLGDLGVLSDLKNADGEYRTRRQGAEAQGPSR
jgi:hypothetical protein